MSTHSYLTREANKAFIKRKNGPDEVIRIVPGLQRTAVQCYYLYTAFEERSVDLGCILFDLQGFWIYDGDLLSIGEQEQFADFIINSIM